MPAYGRYEVGVGILVVAASAVLGFMALQVGAISGFRDTVRVTARLPDAAGLAEGAVVSVAGVQVGRVDRLGVDFDHAVAEVSIDAAAGIRKDVKVAIRARSMLGEKYLELTPVSRDAPLLADGDVLVEEHGQVEIDEMVTRVGPLLDAVDPADVRVLLRALVDAAKDDPERVKRMLADAEVAVHQVRVASEALPALVADTRGTLASVRRAADAARPALDRVDGAVARLDTLLAAVPPEQVPDLLDEVEAAVKDGRAVLTRLDGSSTDLAELLHKANSIDRMDMLRITQEEGVLIRLRPRKREDVAREVAE